jgi:carbamoyl-phosphate synthase large subunit
MRKIRDRVNVLVSSAGRRCELLRIIRADAASLGLACKIVATDMEPEWSAACQEADAYYRVPPATHNEFCEVTEAILTKEDCNLLVPTIDTELEAIARARDALEERHPQLSVLSHAPSFVGICRDKGQTMSMLERIGVPVPKTYTKLGEVPASLQGATWPMIAKPTGGSSSKGIRLVRNEHEFDEAIADDTLLVQDFIQGPEFTVNAYASRGGSIAAVVPHRRITTRGGEVEKGIVEQHDWANEIALCLAENMPGLRGPFNFQAVRRADGRCLVFEINARLGGGYPLAHRAGAHFTKWAMQEGLLGQSIGTAQIEFGWRMMRHDTSVFRR